jgi:hypothetical protein
MIAEEIVDFMDKGFVNTVYAANKPLTFFGQFQSICQAEELTSRNFWELTMGQDSVLLNGDRIERIEKIEQ